MIWNWGEEADFVEDILPPYRFHRSEVYTEYLCLGGKS